MAFLRKPFSGQALRGAMQAALQRDHQDESWKMHAARRNSSKLPQQSMPKVQELDSGGNDDVTGVIMPVPAVFLPAKSYLLTSSRAIPYRRNTLPARGRFRPPKWFRVIRAYYWFYRRR